MAYYPEPCDSYFVESHGGHGRFYRDTFEEGKWQKQEDIGRGLSRLASDDYRNDIVHHMAKMEVKSLTEFDISMMLIVRVGCNPP